MRATYFIPTFESQPISLDALKSLTLSCHDVQILVYDDDAFEFSLLFEDEGEQFRHVIDFKPFHAPP